MTIEVESFDSPTHVVIPAEGEKSINMNEVTAEVESNEGIDLAPSNPIPNPELPPEPD